MSTGSVSLMPAYELMTLGTNADSQMMNALAGSPIPSQRIASGIQAIGGIGRIISKIGLTISSTLRNQPMASPSGTPMTHRGEIADQRQRSDWSEVGTQGRAVRSPIRQLRDESRQHLLRRSEQRSRR